jgi:hypothetical protein
LYTKDIDLDATIKIMYGDSRPRRPAAASSPPKHPTPKARLIDRLIDDLIDWLIISIKPKQFRTPGVTLPLRTRNN